MSERLIRLRSLFDRVLEAKIRKAAQLDVLEVELESLRKRKEELEARGGNLDSAVMILRRSREEFYRRVASSLEGWINPWLQYIYACEMRLGYDFSGRGEACLEVRGPSHEGPVEIAFGGGVADLLSQLLRIGFLFRLRPPRRKILILDETFRYVSGEYLPRVGEAISSLCGRLDMQIILVSHQEELARYAGTVHRINWDQGGSRVISDGSEGS